MKRFDEIGRCSICGGTYTHWGNNPAPLRARKSARRLSFHERCCDDCNMQLVIPARIDAMLRQERLPINTKMEPKGD